MVSKKAVGCFPVLLFVGLFFDLSWSTHRMLHASAQGKLLLKAKTKVTKRFPFRSYFTKQWDAAEKEKLADPLRRSAAQKRTEKEVKAEKQHFIKQAIRRFRQERFLNSNKDRFLNLAYEKTPSIRLDKFFNNLRNTEHIEVLVEGMWGKTERVLLSSYAFKQKHKVEIYLKKNRDIYADIMLEGQMDGWKTVSTVTFQEFLEQQNVAHLRESTYDYVKEVEKTLALKANESLDETEL